MPTFTLREFERIGPGRGGELQPLGIRAHEARNISEGKRWLSTMIAEGRLESGRFYRFEGTECTLTTRRDYLLNISFYLFADGRLCPVRIWWRAERMDGYRNDPEWTVDFEGVPGWSLIGYMEPRWTLVRTVPAERSWMGRSWRDWHRRNCWAVDDSVLGGKGEQAA